MTTERIVELLEIERECMRRGAHNKCDRDCAMCELVQDDKELDEMYTDAIALLKEQEPILLENQHKPYGISTNANSPWISRCPRCGKKVEGKQTRFCKYCGQAVKWELNSYTCCECKYCILWLDDESMCVLRNKYVDGNDKACEMFVKESWFCADGERR